jgi:hypothetical protein
LYESRKRPATFTLKNPVKLLEKHFRFKENDEGVVDAAFRDHFETQTQMITISK